MAYFGLNGLTEKAADSFGILLAPEIEMKDGTRPEATEAEGGYLCGSLLIRDEIKGAGYGNYAITRTIKNVGTANAEFKDIVAVRDTFYGEKYLIPCILYNGNEHGSSNTPKSLEIDGEPWVFAYDRMGIPSCTLTENDFCGLALFASDKDALSLTSSCSLVKRGDFYTHRIYRPVTEAPYTYSSKNIMTERYDTYHTLEAGAEMTHTSYVCVMKPKYKKYAALNLIERVMGLFKPTFDPHLSPEKVFELGIDYANALLYPYNGKKLIITHYAPRLFRYQHMVKITLDEMAEMMKDPYYTEIGAFDERFEMGWADQGLMNGRMLAIDALKNGKKEQLADAIGIFDAFAEIQQENGLCYTLYEQSTDPERAAKATPDCCNLGWGASEMVKMYRLLRDNGIDKPEYLTFARKVCDFFIKNYDPLWGFGKSFNMDGTPAEKAGSIGGFMICAMIDLYNEVKEEKYLDMAKKAHNFYYGRDLDNFVCTAGALDCKSIDKETAYPFVVASLDLYKITKNPNYITRAQKAAYYFMSWMFFYDVLYPNGSEFTEYGYRTTGGTAISAEHHAIDAWGAVIVPELCELAKLTGNKNWEKMARLTWANAIVGLTEREGQLFHGQQRPIGSQNEGFFQARWTKYRPTCEERGHYNDCLCGWSGAYRMMTVDKMEKMGMLDVLR
ncbi:MAG: hypothetical protein IIW21_05810 [Clostridia bacterium]|nr:hypothetical protein [Clostridia bacterium]